MENNKNNNVRNILIASGVAAATAIVAGAVHHIIAKSLMNVAVDRKEPKAMAKSKEKIMGSGELSAIMGTVMDAAKKLEETEHETVEIESFDSTRLVGHWFPCEGAKRVIVAMHGWRSAWSQDFGIICDFWHRNGCSVLYAEQRGQGNSGGEYMGFGLLERHDCLEWTKWVIENTDDSLPVYLCGLSMGATTVLMTSGFDLPERVHGVMADSAFTSPHGIWKHVVQDNLHLPYSIYSGAASGIYKKKLKIDSKEYSCPEALKSCSVPVLFIHGTDDSFVPVTHTYENYKACRSEKRLLVVPGADHCLSYLVDRDSYEAVSLKFWNDFDERIPVIEDEPETAE
ncbi:MAG: alpha/beta hydrolase [Ruminococcaceae bacterium]|nr:alpha/beta hydrolase [Oscillospiraceae bacterium]